MKDQDKSKQQRLDEPKYHRLLQSLMDAFVSVDMDGHIQEYNEVYRKMLGYEPEDLLKLRYMDITPEKWHSYEAEIVQKQILSRGYSDIYKKEYRQKDGTVFPVELRTFLIKDDHDHPCAMWAIVRDITERKRDEEALQKAHDELEQRVQERTAELTKASEHLQQAHDEPQAIYDGIVEGLIITEVETKRFVRVNSSLCRMLGYSEEELLAASVKDIHPPDEAFNDLQLFQAVSEGRVSLNEDRPVLRKDGSIFYADITGHPILYDGRPCTLALFHDNTARKKAEETLQQAHDELQAIYDQAVDGIIIVDAEKENPIRVNSAFCRMIGYSDKEAYAVLPERIHPPEALPKVREHFEAVKKGLVARIDNLPFLRKDGNVVYADVISSPIRYNERPCWISCFHDVTERKLAEQALQQSHDELQVIYDGMVDGLLIADLDTMQFIRSNSAISQMLQYSAAELLSMTVIDIHPAEDIPAVFTRFKERAAGKRCSTASSSVVRKDGSVIPVDIVSNTLTYGGRSCIVGFFRDVTERKRAEEALKKEHRTLKHLLQSSDHERQTIAYEIHDELAQQLAGAIMQFQAYDHLKETKPNLAVKAYEAGMTMLQQGHFETRRLIAGVRPPILDESGIVAAIGHLVHELGRSTKQKIDYHSRVDFDRLAPTLENSIYRIAQEALTNACQHSKSEKVRVSLLQRKDRVRIEIRDWGIGFDTKKVRENHFGLEGIRQRARLLGGKCKIQSLTGKGTRIAVVLPVVERETE